MALSLRSAAHAFMTTRNIPGRKLIADGGAGQRSTRADRRGPARRLPPPPRVRSARTPQAASGLGAAVRCARALAGRGVANLRRRRGRLGVSIEAVRQRAFRNKWARMLGTTDVRAYTCPSRILRKPLSFGSGAGGALKFVWPSLSSRRELGAQTGPRSER
jgi:hypothetical protein